MFVSLVVLTLFGFERFLVWGILCFLVKALEPIVESQKAGFSKGDSSYQQIG